MCPHLEPHRPTFPFVAQHPLLIAATLLTTAQRDLIAAQQAEMYESAEDFVARSTTARRRRAPACHMRKRPTTGQGKPIPLRQDGSFQGANL